MKELVSCVAAAVALVQQSCAANEEQVTFTENVAAEAQEESPQESENNEEQAPCYVHKINKKFYLKAGAGACGGKKEDNEGKVLERWSCQAQNAQKAEESFIITSKKICHAIEREAWEEVPENIKEKIETLEGEDLSEMREEVEVRAPEDAENGNPVEEVSVGQDPVEKNNTPQTFLERVKSFFKNMIG